MIRADKTVVQVLKEPDKPATSESRMWVYASGEYSLKPVRIFEYQPDRKGDRAKAFLRGFSGCLVTDGYAGYNHVEKVIHCGCWSHMQRKWREAMPDGATVETSKAAVGYKCCNKLFARERICKKDNPTLKGRREYRLNVISELLEEYFCWLETVHPKKGGKLYDAVTYAKNQKESLMAFITHGEVPISNNLAENAIRPFTLGRKNWLSCDTVKGAEASSVVYTLVETAKANGIDPYEYLLLVLTMLPYLGNNPSHEELEKLMPWHPSVRNGEHIRNK